VFGCMIAMGCKNNQPAGQLSAHWIIHTTVSSGLVKRKATVAGGFKNWQLINFLATVFSLDVNGNTNSHWCSKNLHAVHYFPLHNPAVKSSAYSECTQYHSLRTFFHRHKLLTQCSANFNITLTTNMATYTSIFKFWLLIFVGDSEK